MTNFCSWSMSMPWNSWLCPNFSYRCPKNYALAQIFFCRCPKNLNFAQILETWRGAIAPLAGTAMIDDLNLKWENYRTLPCEKQNWRLMLNHKSPFPLCALTKVFFLCSLIFLLLLVLNSKTHTFHLCELQILLLCHPYISYTTSPYFGNQSVVFIFYIIWQTKIRIRIRSESVKFSGYPLRDHFWPTSRKFYVYKIVLIIFYQSSWFYILTKASKRIRPGSVLQVRHKQDWGRGFILLLPQTAELPGSDAGSDVIKPASSFFIQNRQTSCSLWCLMYEARC